MSGKTHAISAEKTPHGGVRIKNVGKEFLISHRQYHTLKERALHPFTSAQVEHFQALKDVSVDIQPGEFFGIVGRNGSGKSTLLKCLAGIYAPDRGSVEINGRLSPFIELGVGFNGDLTAYDNVIINAIMLGLTRSQAKERFEDIIAFAELEEFLDLKLKNYSSGMAVRLAFSVAVEVDADILLVDEVLAVGDAAFQQKCFKQFQKLKDAGKTILLVTHDMNSVERFCDRALLLDKGELLEIGKPEEIGRRYNEINFGKLPSTTGAINDGNSTGEAEIKDCWFENAIGERISSCRGGEPLTLCTEIKFHSNINDPIFGFTLRNDVKHTIFATTSLYETPKSGEFLSGDRVTFKVTLDSWLARSSYTLTPSIARSGTGSDTLDIRPDLAEIMIHNTRYSGGVLELPHKTTIDRLG